MKKQMKLVILALVLSLTAFTASAQTTFKKSDKIVEGTASYTKTSDVDASYSLKPTVGYFLTDRFAVGVFGEVAKNTTGTKTLNYGAFSRCYFLTIGNHFKTYSQLDVANNTTDAAGTKTNTLGVNLGLGANYFVTNNLALTLHVANLASYTNGDSNSTFTVGFDGVTNPLSPVKFGVLYRF